MEKMAEKLVFDVQDAAEYLGVCRETVRRELTRGKLRGYKAGWRWRITREELDRYTGKLAS